MASAGTVTVDFAAETAKFTAELKKVNSRLSSVEGSFKTLERVAKGALAFFGGSALLNFAKQAADAADELGKTADKMGLTTERVRAFQIAANEAGVSTEAANKLLVEGQKRLGEAAAGSGEAAKFIKLLGLNVQDLQKLKPDELFKVYADSINGLSNKSEQLAAASALMGRSAQEAFALIQAGAPAIEDAAAFVDRFGLALDRVSIKQIESANDLIGRLGLVSQGAGQRIAAGLSPAIEFFVNKILDATGNTKDLQTTAEGFAQASIVAFGIVANAVHALQAAFFGLAAAVAKGLETLTSPTVINVLKALPGPLQGLAIVVGEAAKNVSASFAASVDANLRKAEEAARKIQSLDAIQQAALKAIEDSRTKAQSAVAAQAAADTAGDSVLLDGVDVESQAARLNEVLVELAKVTAERQKEIAKDVTASNLQEIAKRNEAARQAAEFQYQLEVQSQAAIREQKATTAELAINLLAALGVKSKAFAVAAIVLEKALAIQRVLFANAIAAELAFASQLIPAVPATLATATAAKAAVLAQGRIQAGLLAATGALQIANTVSGGSSANLGTAVNPVFTRGSVDDTTSPGATAQNAVQVIIQGNVFSNRETADFIIEQIQEAVSERDVVLIQNGSRNGQDLLAGAGG